MRLLDGLPYPKMPHFWMVFIWAKLIAFQNKIVPNLWILPPKNKPRSMEYFFAVLKDQDQDRLLRAMSAFIIGRDKKGQIRVIQVSGFFFLFIPKKLEFAKNVGHPFAVLKWLKRLFLKFLRVEIHKMVPKALTCPFI